ncbi:MAG: hypothetical protein WDO15_09155 [Bacteroidota bacterium]
MATALATIFVVSCSKDDVIPPPDLTALKASIAAAQTAFDASVEGKADGQFPTGSKAGLQAAITAGQAVVDNAATTQVQADAAKVSVDTAVTTFQGLVIKPIAAENLIAHWTFDEGTGTTAHDASDNHFDGTLKVGPVAPNWKSHLPTWTSDRSGTANKALHFNGGNVEVPYNTKLNPTAAITVSAWVMADTVKLEIVSSDFNHGSVTSMSFRKATILSLLWVGATVQTLDLTTTMLVRRYLSSTANGINLQ